MRIYEARRRANISTQEHLAKLVGVSRSTVAKWETGRILPNSDKLPKLAKILGCTIDDLFRDEATQQQDTA